MADTVVKIVTREQLTEYVSADRRAGRSIAFANGCFDLLHVGHVRYLQAAAAEADRLIVAVNDDATAATKGPGRPILKAGDRAELVAALRGVDYVTIFHEKSPARLLQRLKPDFQCKGTDYTPESVPEAEVVRAYGGKVVIVGDPKDHSTTAILEKMRRS